MAENTTLFQWSLLILQLSHIVFHYCIVRELRQQKGLQLTFCLVLNLKHVKRYIFARKDIILYYMSCGLNHFRAEISIESHLICNKIEVDVTLVSLGTLLIFFLVENGQSGLAIKTNCSHIIRDFPFCRLLKKVCGCFLGSCQKQFQSQELSIFHLSSTLNITVSRISHLRRVL